MAEGPDDDGTPLDARDRLTLLVVCSLVAFIAGVLVGWCM